jgi:hypothetical protein
MRIQINLQDGKCNVKDQEKLMFLEKQPHYICLSLSVCLSVLPASYMKTIVVDIMATSFDLHLSPSPPIASPQNKGRDILISDPVSKDLTYKKSITES